MENRPPSRDIHIRIKPSSKVSIHSRTLPTKPAPIINKRESEENKKSEIKKQN